MLRLRRRPNARGLVCHRFGNDLAALGKIGQLGVAHWPLRHGCGHVMRCRSMPAPVHDRLLMSADLFIAAARRAESRVIAALPRWPRCASRCDASRARSPVARDRCSRVLLPRWTVVVIKHIMPRMGVWP